MISSVAHEFRNLLNFIKENLKLIEYIWKEERINNYPTSSLISCEMLNLYVEDILDLSRIEREAFS
jgi:signal transduction histidine kinase